MVTSQFYKHSTSKDIITFTIHQVPIVTTESNRVNKKLNNQNFCSYLLLFVEIIS